MFVWEVRDGAFWESEEGLKVVSQGGVQVSFYELAKSFNPLVSAGARYMVLCGDVCGEDCV